MNTHTLTLDRARLPTSLPRAHLHVDSICRRALMLLPSAELSTHPLRYIQPPHSHSLCLLKRLRRADTAAVLASVNTGAPVMRPPTFVIPFTPLSRITVSYT